MKTDYKVGDEVTILPFEVGTVGDREYHSEMLPNIGLVGTVVMVHDDGVSVKTSAGTWTYNFKFIKPLEETSMTSSAKPTTINVINQSPKVRAKLSKALVSLGYNLDWDYGEGSNGNSTSIYNDYRNHDLGAVSVRSSVSTVDATDLKFKAVLKAVMPLLEFSTERYQVGGKVIVLDNPKPEFQPKFKVGDAVKVVAPDSTRLPIGSTYTVTYVEDAGYIGNLPYQVKSGSITDWVGHTALELVHEEPAELKQAGFKFTRVKVKATGAKGVVIGNINSYLCVQFDKSSDSLHRGGSLHGYRGADKRCWFHNAAELEIIGGTHA